MAQFTQILPDSLSAYVLIAVLRSLLTQFSAPQEDVNVMLLSASAASN